MNIARTALLAALAAAATCAQAQMDNVVEVENSYRPTVKDANKINVLPEVEPTRVKHYNVNYAGQAIPPKAYTFQPMQAAQSDAAIEGAPRGFLTLGGGNNGQASLRGAYGWKMTERDFLDFDLSLRGHNATVDRALKDGDEWKSRFYTTRTSVGYEHKLAASDASILLDADVESQVFNYSPDDWIHETRYYAPFTPAFEGTDKQHNLLGGASIRLTPFSPAALTRLTIAAGADFKIFSQKYLSNDFASADKASENQVGGHIQLGWRFDPAHAVGLDLSARNFSYAYDEFSSLFSATIRPHYDLAADNLRLSVGAKLYFSSGFKKTFRVAPDVHLTYDAAPTLQLFAQASGGEILNDFRHFAQMTPYWRHSNAAYYEGENTTQPQFAHQFDQLRALAGVRWNIAQGLFAKLYGGYDLSKNRAEIIRDGLLFAADGSLFHINADLRYDHRDIFRLSASTQWNGWQTDAEGGLADNATAWRPTLQLQADATLRIIPRLYAGADILLQTFERGADLLYERPTTLNLGASLSYRLPVALVEQRGGAFTLFARGDNLLGRSYDAYNQYRAIGTTILAGAAITF